MTPPRIPLYDPSADIGPHLDEYLAALRGVLESGRFILGPTVAEFEEAAAAYLGAAHAVGVNSGTDALVLGLEAMGIGPGDEVVTTPFTFFATSEAVGRVGAEVVFADIDPESFNIDPDAVRAAITPRTMALLPVHLFGRAAAMDRLAEVAGPHGLAVLEDVAQAMGGTFGSRKLGTLGAAGAFSFFPTKNLGGFGDGGLIVTDDEDLAASARALRAHGARRKYHNERLGWNSRLDALQAALLLVKLRRLDADNAGRRDAAARYGKLLDGIEGVVIPDITDGHVVHQYTIRITDGRRDGVREALDAAGVSTLVYYPVPLHRLPLYADRRLSYPEAERAAAEVLSLPMWPAIDAATQERVAAALAAALA